jgi:DNA-directed RNA polymerase subunit RPC12/RpoP
MDEDKKKKVMLGLIILCLVLAIGITVLTNTGGSGGGGSRSNEPVQMLCMNEECGADFELSTEEYREHMMQGGMMGPGPMAQAPIECPECGMQSAFRAVKCKECGAIFMQDYSSGDFPDRCPECEYSDIEARRDAAK